MATTTKAAAPAKKNSGFKGVKDAWIILVICCIIAYCFYFFVLGDPSHFQGGDRNGHPADLMGTVYKGGFVVGLIITLLLSVIVLGVERFFAIKSASGKINLAKFTAQVKEAIKAQDFTKAKDLCNKMQGSVANVVLASINMYETVEKDDTLKKSQKISKIQQAHEEATQLEMPTLTMNLPMVATIVSLGTLTALFGTVLGMIGSFQALSAGGGADSMALSAGISEALVNTASGKINLAKFTAQVKEAIKAQDFSKAKDLCNKMQGSVANVVLASINMYQTVEGDDTLKKSQKISKIQQAHEEATQLEMPTLTMNLPMIATIVSLGTLTALFGTVLGMIGSFQALSAGGGADSMALSAGISEALVNTASGILTSWVATVVYNFFSNKIDKLTFALDEVGYTIAATYDSNHHEA